jgi:hypothetical protein
MTTTRHVGMERLEKIWAHAWQTALADWSRFTKLADPRWCFTEADEEREGLSGSFAMIRLVDHAVVISLRQILQKQLTRFAREILAHEIGHHVYAPADLRDNARLQGRVRAGLPTRESYTGIVANLYTDLLINDRLQRDAGLDMTGVYRALSDGTPGDRLWRLYMRIYETLWRLPSGTLVPAAAPDDRIALDASLGARLIRAYARDWLNGAGRFAALLLPYLLAIPETESIRKRLPTWFDADQAGAGAEVPDGLAEVDPDEQDGAIHPSEDKALAGVEGDDATDDATASESAASLDASGREAEGGRKKQYRDPSAYRDLLKSLGVTVSEKDLTVRYYRERALPYLINYPTREVREAMDPLPEGLDTWEVGDSLRDIDWSETIARSASVIPGVTTVRREYGVSPGSSPERLPLDLYVGIDCSGSMTNPSVGLSYPVLAGTVIALSALRTGAQVMACLSGEPGTFSETAGFVRNERAILSTLTGYLGSGYAFGISRLDATFLKAPVRRRPTHILVVSDQDIFSMLNRNDGWTVAQQAIVRAGGGGTFVLETDPHLYAGEVERMREIGWDVHTVRSQADLPEFARAFSRAKYGQPVPGGATRTPSPRTRTQP